MSARLEPPDELRQCVAGLDDFQSIGGERRMARFSVSAQTGAWTCPAEAAQVISAKPEGGAKCRIRMQLVTPAIFDEGWRPRWICEATGVKLQLVSAAIDRWRPVSGWSYEHGKPKPVRRVVPAGSVYFFESDAPPADIGSFWLAPVSDKEQDRRDGFGLAVWGVWQQHPE